MAELPVAVCKILQTAFLFGIYFLFVKYYVQKIIFVLTYTDKNI